jgi:hypothetical protein
VLTRDAHSGGYTGQQVPLSQTCAFGLFVLPGDDSARIRYESFTGELDRDERARFHLAYSVPGNDVGSPRTFRFQAPKESIRIPMENTYPDLVVRLDNGRELRADALTWEPSYEQTIDINDGGNSRKLVIQRMRLRADELFNNRRFHYIEPQPFEGDPIRLPNTCVFAWLSSDPMSRKSVYSELVVMFFVEFRKNTTLEQLLWEGVHDLDWEAHAEDVDEKTVALWKQAWLTKTVH